MNTALILPRKSGYGWRVAGEDLVRFRLPPPVYSQNPATTPLLHSHCTVDKSTEFSSENRFADFKIPALEHRASPDQSRKICICLAANIQQARTHNHLVTYGPPRAGVLNSSASLTATGNVTASAAGKIRAAMKDFGGIQTGHLGSHPSRSAATR